MKKLLTLLLAILMCTGVLAACDSQPPSVPNTDDESEKSTTTSDSDTTEAEEPETEAQKPADPWLNVATYNILHAMDYPSYVKGETDINPDHIADFIYDNKIEICGLNEVDINCDRSSGFRMSDYYKGGSNQPKYIAEVLTERTGEQYYWAFGPALEGALAAAHSGSISMYGNAVISKYPILSVRNIQVWDKENHIIDPDNPKSQIYDRPEAQGGGHFEIKASLIVELDVNGTTMTVISTHFGLTSGEKTAMAEAIKKALKDIDTPVMLMGDMNLSYDTRIIQEFNLLLTPTSTAAKPATFVSGSRIDYIFTGGGIAFKELKVHHNITYSDHYPVSVKVKLPPATVA